MAFKVCNTKTRGSRVPDGYVSLTTAGRLAIHRQELVAIGINGAVTLLVDCETKRIGLRAPREQADSRTAEPHVRVWERSTPRRVEVSVLTPLRELGLDAKQLHGRYELHRHPKDRLLYICLLEDETP